MEFKNIKSGAAIFPNRDDEESIMFIQKIYQYYIEYLEWSRVDQEFKKDKLRESEFKFFFGSRWRTIDTNIEALHETIKELFEQE